MEAMIKLGQEQRRPEIKTSLEEMKTTTNSIQSKLEDTIKNHAEDVLSSVNQQLKEKVEETNLGLQTAMTSLNMQTKSLCEKIKHAEKDLHKLTDVRIQGTQVRTQTERCKFKMQLAEAEA
jgi:gas vesicle protein